MGQRGPKPLPSNVHRLRGNPSKLRPDQLRDSVHPTVSLPKPPPFLSREAKKEWARLGPELVKYGLVSELDRGALAAYCQAYGRWEEAERLIKSLGEDGLIDITPSGYKQIGVWLQISNRAVETMRKYEAEFGLTPSARSRVQPSENQPDLFDDGAEKTGPARFFND